jgi:hypothetical protein
MRIAVLALAVLAVAPLRAANAAALDGPAILDRVRATLAAAGNQRADFTLDVQTPAWSARRSGRIYKENGAAARHTLIVFDEPAQFSDMKILSRRPEGGATQTWLYVPAAHRARRVASSENGRGLFGASFSASDLEHRGADVMAAVRRVEPCSGEACWVVDLTGAENGVAVSELLWVRQRDFRVARREFHGRTGLRRVYTADVLEVADGVPTPVVMTIDDRESDARSTVRLRDVRYGVAFDPAVFTVQRLDSRIVSLDDVPEAPSPRDPGP